MQIITKKDAKTAVSALRRELKNLGKSSETLSHSDCLTLMAKALGFSSWNEWESKLTDDAPEVKVELSRYPLKNTNGQYDFIAYGENGAPYSSFFNYLTGTSDTILATAYVNEASRDADGLQLEFADHGSEVHWDTQETQEKDGERLWTNSDGQDVPESRVILLPERFCEASYQWIYDDEDEELTVRKALVDEFITWFMANTAARQQLAACTTKKAILKVIDSAEATLGFALIRREVQALLKEIDAEKVALV